MKTLKLYLESKVEKIKFKCEQTGKEIEPIYVALSKESLDSIIQKYKLNKEQFNDLLIFLSVEQNNSWIVKTKTNYKLDISRTNDKFISSNNINYSYDDVINMIENENKMLVFVKENKNK